ncbi:MAG: hypothetical protein A7316_04585 [Candidatus Altiarchaeales archaeon WOR_SM1_86-2]|nr:MAG: hypothetical protein A7316_04585 [Candidatus Altiarchaeales archaeon WOR_SM1_86-2]
MIVVNEGINRAQTGLEFAMITADREILEKSNSHITPEVVENISHILGIIEDISADTRSRFQFIKIDGGRAGEIYRLLVYPISKKVYGVLLTKVELKEEFIPAAEQMLTLRRLLSLFVEDFEKILFKAGKNSGRACIRYFKNSGIDGEEAIKGASAMLSACDIINPKWEIKKDHITVVINNSWENSEVKEKAEKPSCYHTQGIISGIIKGALMRPGEIEEVECKSMGDKECKFIFR